MRTTQGIFVSQNKYVLDLIKDYSLSHAKAFRLPINTQLKLFANSGIPL